MIRKFLIGIFLCVAVILTYLVRENIYMSAASLADKYGFVGLTEDIYLHVLSINPNNYSARYDLSLLYFENDMEEMGIETFLASEEVAGNYYHLYLLGSKYMVEEGETQRAIDFLNSVNSQYLQRKLLDFQPEEASIVPNPGNYDRLVSVKFSSDDTVFYKIDEDADYKLYTKSFVLDYGETTLYYITYNDDGMFSDECIATYNVDKIQTFAQKQLEESEEAEDKTISASSSHEDMVNFYLN